MKRFVTKTMVEGREGSPDHPDGDNRRQQKRVDTGLGLKRDTELKESDYKVSISPGKDQRRRGNHKTFEVKPTEINHFTGKRMSNHESVSPDRRALKGSQLGDGRGMLSPASKNEGPELKVQLGDQTQIFKGNVQGRNKV